MRGFGIFFWGIIFGVLFLWLLQYSPVISDFLVLTHEWISNLWHTFFPTATVTPVEACVRLMIPVTVTL